MRKFTCFLLGIGLSYATLAQNWQLVWADEFTNGIGPDWVFETGSGGWGNNELQYYRQQNASVQNGQLVITAQRQSFNGSNYTSARMKTQGRKSWRYGKIEARISMPSASGLWPAFWMLGSNISSVSWPACGEIDIMEHINTESQVHGTIHWQDHTNQHASYGGSTNVNVTGFHVYSIEWNANSIKWFVDGTRYHEANISNGINGTGELQNDFFILLNMAVGGNWPGFNIDNNALPAQMRVDYVRVYQLNTTPPPGGNITVRARGTSGSESIQLRVNNSTVATWTLSTGYQNYSASGSGDVSVHFVNDASGRDVQVDYVQVNGTTLQAENQAINTALWANGSCGGGSHSEWMNCNGYIQFTGGTTPPPSFSQTIQAEAYSTMSGVQTESTSDTGGGTNVGWIDAGDWMSYSNIAIPSSGSYLVEYRVASMNGGGQLSLDINAGATVLGTRSIPSTGGWQNWTTVSHTVTINAGTYPFGIYATTGGWNLNWWRISSASGGRVIAEWTAEEDPVSVNIYPNPASEEVNVSFNRNYEQAHLSLTDINGREVFSQTYHHFSRIKVKTDAFGKGIYFLHVRANELEKTVKLVLK